MNSKSISIETPVAQSPKSHWRARANAHEKNLASLLTERGLMGMCVQGAELYDQRELYGVSPRSRVSDLIRKRGWDIGSKLGKRGCQCYWVRRDGDGRTYPTGRFEEPVNQAESSFMRRRREEVERAAPLFARAA